MNHVAVYSRWWKPLSLSRLAGALPIHLSKARAMLLPIEVLPTPGGPTKHMIFPCTEPDGRLVLCGTKLSGTRLRTLWELGTTPMPFRKLTAMCSRIRSLTSCNTHSVMASCSCVKSPPGCSDPDNSEAQPHRCTNEELHLHHGLIQDLFSLLNISVVLPQFEAR